MVDTEVVPESQLLTALPLSSPRSRELGELNLFEELRETIYTEVATLISQNESRPQYLLQLFSELQGMTSDLMRQRAIFALQEIAQSTLVAADAGGGREAALMKVRFWPAPLC